MNNYNSLQELRNRKAILEKELADYEKALTEKYANTFGILSGFRASNLINMLGMFQKTRNIFGLFTTGMSIYSFLKGAKKRRS